MQNFSEIKPKELQNNAISLIGDSWMLVSAGNLSDISNTSWNTMTANWGGLGFLWNKPVAFVFIRTERFTYEFTEKEDTMSLSFFAEEYKTALQFCGTKSGRDFNKANETGLTPIELENKSVGFSQANIILECKKLYCDMINRESFTNFDVEGAYYTKEGLHKLYICEITKVWKK